MTPIIATEHFTLTSGMRDDLDKSLSKLERILPEETQVRVFLTLDKGSIYRALCKTHVGHMEFVAESTAYDLHAATSHSCESLRHQIVEHKNKHRRVRRKDYATV